MATSEESIVESEKFLAEDETLGESISSNGLGNDDGVKICIHHWVIEPPHGSMSSGACKKCGEYRKDYFANSSDNVAWSGGRRYPQKRVSRNKKRELEDRRIVNEISDSDLE